MGWIWEVRLDMGSEIDGLDMGSEIDGLDMGSEILSAYFITQEREVYPTGVR